MTNESLHVFNTLSRQLEDFQPLRPDKVLLYTCGPTVYDFAHIGNFRTYVFEDILRRTLEFFNYTVDQVMNITDVDDKTIRGAIRQGTTLEKYVQPYIDAFFEDLDALHIQRASAYPKATDFIPQMIEKIEALIAKGVAYAGKDGSVYFAIERFPQYGCLSHLDLSSLQVGASERVTADEYDKDNVSDFVVWKAWNEERDGEIYWDSPWGRGRPGWHLECSVMAMQLLGASLDIHCGGVDNIFPHHENEIAQSECLSGQQFSKYWMHSEHLVVDGKKMSKSLGNFYTLRDLLEKGYTGTQVRYLLMQTHYKTKLNFTLQGLEAAKGSLQRLDDFILRLQNIQDEVSEEGMATEVTNKYLQEFSDSLSDDLNMSAALAAVVEMVREIHTLADQAKVSQRAAQYVLDALEKMNAVLGVLNFEVGQRKAPPEVEEALAERIEARKNKDWARADELRDFITQSGFTIEDTSQGAILKPL